MSKTALQLLLMFILLTLSQAIVFNNLVLFNVAVPFVFIYMIIVMPITFSANLAMTIGFLTGLTVDVLSDTLGVNALCATVLAFVRRPIFHLYMASDVDLAEQLPSPRTMGTPAYLKFALTMSAIYCLLFFTVEAFQIFDWMLYLLRIIAGSIYTFVLIYAIACMTPSREKKL